jgi:hypothetical protein
MCKLKSAIVLKDRVFMPYDYDSHEDMIRELKLKDNTKEPNFVRVEIVPPDEDLRKPLKDWIYKVDQDYLPEWYSAKFVEKEVRKELKKWYSARVFIDKKDLIIKEGKVYLCGSSSAELYGSSSAKLYGSSSAKLCGSSSAELYDSSSAELYGSSLAELYDSSSAKLYGSSSAELYGSSSAKLYGSSSAIIPEDYSRDVKIIAIKNLASVKDLRINKIFTADNTLKQEVFKDYLPK